MIRLKTDDEIRRLRAGGKRLAAILAELVGLARPGVTTAELDAAAYRLVTAGGDAPSFLHYRPRGAKRPYPASLCVSVNNEVVHGIPGERELTEGDVVSLDLGLCHEGLYTDMARTVVLGEVSPEVARLLSGTEAALAAGIAAARAGAHIGDIGAAVSSVSAARGLGLVTELGGHGVGHAVHEAPEVANDGRAGAGAELMPGLVIAIEPMCTLGGGAVNFLADGYTVVTADGSLAAHFEDTIVVTPDGPEVLTML